MRFVFRVTRRNSEDARDRSRLSWKTSPSSTSSSIEDERRRVSLPRDDDATRSDDDEKTFATSAPPPRCPARSRRTRRRKVGKTSRRVVRHLRDASRRRRCRSRPARRADVASASVFAPTHGRDDGDFRRDGRVRRRLRRAPHRERDSAFDRLDVRDSRVAIGSRIDARAGVRVARVAFRGSRVRGERRLRRRRVAHRSPRRSRADTRGRRASRRVRGRHRARRDANRHLGETFGGDSRRRRRRTRADDVRRVFFLRRVVPRVRGANILRRRERVVGRSRGASIAFGRSDRRRAVGPVGRRGMATRDSTLRAELAKRIRVSRSEDGVAALRAAIEVARRPPNFVSNPSCAWRARRGGGSRRTRQNVAETSRRSSPTSSNERDGSRIMRRDRRGHRRASPSIPTEPNPSLRSRLCVPIDRSIWRR